MTWLDDLDHPDDIFSARWAVKALLIWLCFLTGITAAVAAILLAAAI